MILTSETLSALVDGELGPREQARVEQALTRDAAARQTVNQLRRGADLLRAAYGEPLSKPVPRQLQRLLDPATADDRSPLEPAATAPVTPTRESRRHWFPVALAAAVAALALTALASYFLAEYHVDRRLAAQAALIRADYELSRSARSQALERHISGETVSWANPDSGSRGDVTPLRTFKTSKDQWCREYIQQAELISDTAFRRAVACREPDGSWRDHLEILNES